MNRAFAFLAAATLVVAATPVVAQAPSAADALPRAIRAYDDLDFDGAAALLRRALAVQGPGALAPADAARALIYLAATEAFRDRRDSALAVARRLVLLDPEFRPDEFIFPPQILSLFDEARRSTPVVTAYVPRDTAFRPGAEALRVRLNTNAFHRIAVVLTAGDGRVVRRLYAGPIGDTLEVRWNGLDSSGVPVPAGAYAVTVSSLEGERRFVRILHVPLDVTAADTLPHPRPPADSLLRRERVSFGPALKVLAPGVLAGAAIAVLPGVVASGEDATGARFVVGGAVTIAGIAAFVSRRPGRAIPANVTHNAALRDAWRRSVDDVRAANAARRGESRFVVRAGAPTRISPAGP